MAAYSLIASAMYLSLAIEIHSEPMFNNSKKSSIQLSVIWKSIKNYFIFSIYF